MEVLHEETLRGGVKIEVILLGGGHRAEIHSDGQYRGAPMMMAFRGTVQECRDEYRRIKQHEAMCS